LGSTRSLNVLACLSASVFISSKILTYSSFPSLAAPSI
jgi:hypothetical protein